MVKQQAIGPIQIKFGPNILCGFWVAFWAGSSLGDEN